MDLRIEDKKHVFIIGSKGIPARYGGFETFVDKLTKYRISDKIYYHVAVLSNTNGIYRYNNAECFEVKVPDIGAGKAVYYDIAALHYCIQYCRKKPEIREPVFYVLACRIGPFIAKYKKRIEQLGGRLYINPDGHEWLRGKWKLPIKKYWKLSEQYMVKYADLMICDSIHIEKYVLEAYKKYHPRTKYISYGSETEISCLSDNDPLWQKWLQDNGLYPNRYYIVVGRFVPENNFEVMLREFMISKSSKDLVIITTENPRLSKKLEKKLHFSSDSRIKFAGTVYNDALLRKIRENAYGYIHGHEVGGTNPSLLESLGLTKLNLLLNIGFNYEAARESALYWTKEPGNLAALIESADIMSQEEIVMLGKKARKRIFTAYSWEDIVELYEDLFLNNTEEDR